MRLRPYSLLVLLLVALASCSKKTKVPVPADASMVIHIDGKSLSSKFNWEDFKKSELYSMASQKQEMDSLAKKILENPENSGIDIKSDAFFFMKKRGPGGYMGFTCSIKDEKAFTELMKKSTDNNDELTKQGSLNILKKDGGILTWNSSRFVAINDEPGGKMYSMGGGSSYEFGEDSLLKFANEIYDIKESNSIGSNDKFSSMMKDAGDFHIWVNNEKLYEGQFGAATALTKASDLFKGNVSAVTVSFENGKIVANSKSYYNEKLAAIYTKNPLKNLNEDMLKKIPSDNVVGVIAANYPTAALNDILTTIGVDGMANLYLTEMGLNLTDILKSLKGDVVVAVTDVDMKLPPEDMPEEMMMYYRPRPTANVLVATSLEDPATFNKLLSVAQNEMGKQGMTLEVIAKLFPYQVRDGWFIGSTDSTMTNNFGKSNIDHSFIRRISGHPIGGYLNFKKLITGLKPMMKGAAEQAVMNDATAVWEDLIFYGGEMKDGVMTGHMEVNLGDKNTNSIKQIVDFIGRMAKQLDNHNKEAIRMEAAPDSVIVDPSKVKVEEIK